jgi:putative peptide zinc metalloprotease protein
MQIETPKRGGLTSIRSKSDRIAEALEKGLKVPWQGLRPDLVLHKGSPLEDGSETYVLEDPVRGQHFELGEADAQFFLCLVTEKDLKTAVDKLLRTTSLRPSVEDILSFLRMLQSYKLADIPEKATLALVSSREYKEKPGFFFDEKGNLSLMKVFFFMVPLARPDAFLTAVYPWVKPLWSKPMIWLYSFMGIVGAIFAIQQIELYLNTTSYLFTGKGAAMFFLSLYGIKILHELGHAFAAKHHGIFVRRMGIYFMFFAPMLFTDVTDAWKVPTSKGRLMIASAGVMVEFFIGCICLFFWAILPDGEWRSLMFFMSGASVVSTILVNMNPLMRFDGYYFLMDYFRISNMRMRSQLMYRHFLLRIVADWKGPKPEEHPRERFMAMFGFFSGLYLFVIVGSINLMIYMTVSKVMALWDMFFFVLIIYGGAIVRETRYIWNGREHIGSKLRIVGIVAIVIIGIASMFIPVQSSDKLPSLFLYRDVARLDSPGRGKISTDLPPVGKEVQKGEVLVKIKDDSLEQEMEKLRYDLQQTEVNISHLSASGAQGAYRKWLLAEKQRLNASIEKNRQLMSQLEIVAPISGRILDVSEYFRKGSYVHRKGYILTVGNDRSFEVRAYAEENKYRYFKEKDIREGEVVFEDIQTPKLMAKFRKIMDFPVNDLPNNALFDFAGGHMMSSMGSEMGVGASIGGGGKHSRMRSDRSESVKPKDSQYPIIFDIPSLNVSLHHGMPCVVRIKGDKISPWNMLLDETWRFLAEAGLI